jgi:glycosyltransferase involved in cell wall biosynthesis
LIEAGFDPDVTAVLPLFLSLPRPSKSNYPYNDTDPQKSVTWLTVGRIAPNKALEDVLRIFAIYHHNINPNSQLLAVGSCYLTNYVEALQQLIIDLELLNKVHLVGHVSDSQLQNYYELADLYLTASLHEGFCVPLLESMVY